MVGVDDGRLTITAGLISCKKTNTGYGNVEVGKLPDCRAKKTPDLYFSENDELGWPCDVSQPRCVAYCFLSKCRVPRVVYFVKLPRVSER